jgi:hypothetical protein
MEEKLNSNKMKLIKYSLVLLSVVFFLASCEKDYDSFITTETPAPVMELIGSNPLVLFKGTPYVEPGIYAAEIANGDTTELEYEVLNEVNVDITGTYKLQYKVTNSEGYDFYISRNVNIVSFTGYDVFEIPSGTYDGIRVNRNVGGVVQITKLAPGVYQISDLLGGYYDQYVGYGPATAAPAILVIEENGEIRTELGNTEAWGEVTGSNFSFDAENSVLTFSALIVDEEFGFDVQLTLK